MARVLSSAMLQDIYSQQTGEAVLVLLTLDHTDLGSPLRVSSDAVDTVSNGDTFVAFPFDIVLPDEPEDDRSPRARLRISNVEQDITDTLKTISGAPTITMQIIRASAPDTIEVSWPDFKLREATYDSLYVQGELTLDDFMLEPYPADIYAPSTFPGLF